MWGLGWFCVICCWCCFHLLVCPPLNRADLGPTFPQHEVLKYAFFVCVSFAEEAHSEWTLSKIAPPYWPYSFQSIVSFVRPFKNSFATKCFLLQRWPPWQSLFFVQAAHSVYAFSFETFVCFNTRLFWISTRCVTKSSRSQPKSIPVPGFPGPAFERFTVFSLNTSNPL